MTSHLESIRKLQALHAGRDDGPGESIAYQIVINQLLAVDTLKEQERIASLKEERDAYREALLLIAENDAAYKAPFRVAREALAKFGGGEGMENG